jgi:hypothetical protein
MASTTRSGELTRLVLTVRLRDLPVDNSAERLCNAIPRVPIVAQSPVFIRNLRRRRIIAA